MTDDRLDWHLWNWSNWQRTGRGARDGRGYPGLASGGMGKSHGADFDQMVIAADARCALVVEAALWDCTPVERWSIHNKYLNCVYTLRDEEQNYNSAREKIKKALTRHGID